MGRNNQNTAIHVERNLIYGNGRNGITFIDADGGPHQLIENTIHGNAWSGVKPARTRCCWPTTRSRATARPRAPPAAASG